MTVMVFLEYHALQLGRNIGHTEQCRSVPSELMPYDYDVHLRYHYYRSDLYCLLQKAYAVSEVSPLFMPLCYCLT